MKRMVRWTLSLILILLAVAAAGAYVFYSRIDQPYKGYDGSAREIEIPMGASTKAIGDTLVDSGVIRDSLTFRVALWAGGDARRLKAGDYRFDGPMTARQVIGKIVRGEVALVNVTFREGLTIAEMAGIFESQGFGSAQSFREAARTVSLISEIDPEAKDLEGYLFPDTYPVSRHVHPDQLVKAMVDRFTQVMTPDLRTKTATRGLSVRQLVTLASIVEKETGAVEERPMVAAVYSNRLKVGMGLQCDPTVIYALQRAGKFNGNLRRDDLQFDSPYNTYRYAGLPPGPIAAPGRASLEAALKPAEVDYLYFVSRNDGTHAFARSLDEHNRNVQKFQIQYFRERRLAARGEVSNTVGR
jgi:UPF0755 protein